MRIGKRLAIKSVVDDIEATPEEIGNILQRKETLFKVYPTLRDVKVLKEFSTNTKINYNIFPGAGPIDDRDFIVLNYSAELDNGKTHVDVSADIQHPYPLPSGTVRAQVLILGYIVEKKDEKRSKVTYLSDGDVKGWLPSCIKRKCMEEEGPIAGMLRDWVIECK